MGTENLNTTQLVESAVPPRDVVIAGDPSMEPDDEIRCAICGTPASEAEQLPVEYSNPVCETCDALAVNDSNEEPWTGYPQGERPDTEDSVIHLEPDHGENPVFIAGVKCWRRYRFGGWVTRRDAYDCNSLDEFRKYHRLDGHPIHAFNVAQPDGVDITRDDCAVLWDRYDRLQTLYEEAKSLVDGSPDVGTVESVRERLVDLDASLESRLPDSSEFEPIEVAVAVTDEVEALLHGRWTANDSEVWITRAKLCQRYFNT